MAEIGVMVVKAVPIDRDGAVSLVKSFIEYVRGMEIDVRDTSMSPGGAFDLATKFISRYADLKPGEELKAP